MPGYLKKYFTLLFFSISIAYAQQPVFRHFTVEDGLPGSEVYCVMQDHKGFTWFATDHGVCRFDGTSFKTFTIDDGLADNTVFDIIEDSKHRLWFHSFSGHLSFYLDGKFYSIKNNEDIGKLLAGEVLTTLYVSPDDVIWLGLTDQIYQLKLHEDLSCTILKKHNFHIIDLPGSPVENRAVEAIACKLPESGPVRIRLGQAELSLPVSRLGFDSTASINMGCSRLQDGTWLACASNMLIHFNKQGLLHTRRFNSRILQTYQQEDGDVWVALYKGGIIRFKKEDLFSGRKGQSYLDHLSVSSCLADRQGGHWFSTLESGVYFLPSEAFYHFPQIGEFKDKKIVCVGGRLSGPVFMGLMNSGLLKLDNEHMEFLWNPDRSSFHSVNTVFHRSNGELWVGLNNEVFILNPDYSLIRRRYLFNSFAEEDPHTLWAAGNAGIYQFKGQELVNTYKKLKAPINIRKIAYWKDRLWIASVNGLWSFRDGKLEYRGKESPLLRQRINDLETDRKGRLWMASRAKGILIKTTDTLIQIGVKDGLLSNICNSLLVDKDQDVWVATNSGLSRICDFKENGSYRIENYTVDNGLISNEINEVFRQGNNIWVATNNGLCLIDLDHLASKSSPPPVYITGITVNNTDTALLNGYEFPYYKNNIRLSFVGISYTSGNNMRYKYSLKNNSGQKENEQITNKNELQFSTLIPGEYLFSVWAKNAEGIWSTTPATLHFTIRPPFWATWWFRLLYMLVAGFFIAAVIRWRFRQLLAQGLLKSELNEVKQQALSARMNPHFMFNALNSIQNYISLDQTGDAHKYLANFSRLMRLILVNSKDTFVPLSTEIEALKIYTDLEMLRFEERMSCRITIDPSLEGKAYKIPGMMIQPYVENAIKHGLAAKKRNGKLDIVFKKEGDTILCSIRDNGIGRTKAGVYSDSKQKQLRHESMGTSLTESRIKLLKSIYKRQIRAEITDLYTPKGIASGTLVMLYFPAIADFADEQMRVLN